MGCCIRRIDLISTHGKRQHGPLDVLRTFAVAPYNARLNRQIGGDPEYVDHVCRWLRGALELRTLSLILEKQT